MMFRHFYLNRSMNRSNALVGCCCLWLAIVFLLTTETTANAGLVLTIDTSAKTFSFSGSDAGIFSNFGANPYKFASWQATGLGGGVTDFSQNTVRADGLWSSSVGSPTSGFLSQSFFIQVDNQGFPAGQVMVGLFNTVNGPTTVTGLGGNTSYASLHPANIAQFESLIGGSIPLSSGSDFGSITVSAVPEPSSLLLVGLAVFGAVGRRRRVA